MQAVARAEAGEALLGVARPREAEAPQPVGRRRRQLDHRVVGAGLRDLDLRAAGERVAERLLRDHALGELDELILDRAVADPRDDRSEQAMPVAAERDGERGRETSIAIGTATGFRAAARIPRAFTETVTS